MLSAQARGRRGPCLHTELLSDRVNTLGPALNKCHSQWGRSRPSPPARLHADNPSQKLCWSDPAVACVSGVGKVGEERYCSGSGVDYDRSHGFLATLMHIYSKSLFVYQMFSVHTGF